MWKRRLLLAVSVYGLLLIGVAAAWKAARPAPQATRENFERLRVGMTIKEAEAILGKPCKRDGNKGDLVYQWDGPEGTVLARVYHDYPIMVVFRPVDGQDTVKELYEVNRGCMTESLFGRVSRLLHLPF